jgi:uncharacterized protein
MDSTSSSALLESSPKSGVLGWVQRHSLLAAYGIVFLLVWGIILSALIGLRGKLPNPLYLFLQLLAGWAPAIAAITVSAFAGGRAAVRDLLKRLLIVRLGFHWYLAGLFLMGGIILGGIGLHVLFGGAMPQIPAATSTSFWGVISTFIIMVVVGVLVNTEEILWRGFALPRLQSRYGWLIACLLLAIPEILLHLPNFWDPDATFYRSVGIVWFSAFSLAAVILYAWVFNHTKGSLVIVTLMHASQNAWANLLSDNSLRPFQFTVGLMGLIALAIIAGSIFSSRSRHTREGNIL